MHRIQSCTYSAPIPVLLAGGSTQFEPHLICAGEDRIVVTASRSSKPSRPHPLSRELGAHVGAYDWDVRYPEGDHEDPCVVGALLAATAACVHHLETGRIHQQQESVKRAYEWEKQVLAEKSRAYCIVALTAGLMFYRKEFPTHTTIIQFPFHIPRTWDISVDIPNNTLPLDQTIRRLVFAIKREGEKMFRTALGSIANKPSHASFQGCELISSVEAE